MACTDYPIRHRCRNLALLLVLAVAMLHGHIAWSGADSVLTNGMQETATAVDTDCCTGRGGSVSAACVTCLYTPPSTALNTPPPASGNADLQPLDWRPIQRFTVPPLRPPITS